MAATCSAIGSTSSSSSGGALRFRAWGFWVGVQVTGFWGEGVTVQGVGFGIRG